MAVETRPVTSCVKYRDSIRQAVSKSTCAPSIAVLSAASGAGRSAPFSCLRRLAGKAGRFWANDGCEGPPPGMRKPLTSQALTAASSPWACSRSQAFAAGSSSFGDSTTSSMTPVSRACAGDFWAPGRIQPIRAAWIPSMRVRREMPPAPGSRPRLTSGRPSLTREPPTQIRWWQASAISSPPPSAEPLSAATTGMPRVSRRRSCPLIDWVRAKISSSSPGPAARSALRSPPAKKSFLALVSTTPRIESRSASSRSSAFSRASW